ncbi:MAG: hypothetical protein ACK5NY_01520 [Burkholderiaceae bacterium]
MTFAAGWRRRLAPPVSFYASLEPEEKDLFMQQILDGRLSTTKISAFWKERGKSLSAMTVWKYRNKPEIAPSISRQAENKVYAAELQKHAQRIVTPKIKRLEEMAAETYELAKMDPKRQYKAMTDAMNVLLGVTRLEAEVTGELGAATKQEAEPQVNLSLSNMIILPRSAPYQAARDEVVDVETVGEEVPIEEDLRLIEDA